MFSSHPPTKHYTFLPSFYYVMQLSVLIRVKDIKVVQFERKFHYIIPGREFFTTSKYIYIYIYKIRINSKSLMCRKRKLKIMKILIVYLFQNVFNDSPFPSIFFLFLDTAWTNILFYCFDFNQVQFQTSKINSSMFF